MQIGIRRASPHVNHVDVPQPEQVAEVRDVLLNRRQCRLVEGSPGRGDGGGNPQNMISNDAFKILAAALGPKCNDVGDNRR